MRSGLWVLSLSLSLLLCVGVAGGKQRSLAVDDILRMEDVGRVVMTPDGRYVVYEWFDAYEKAPNQSALGGLDDRSVQAKLFLVDLSRSGRPRPLLQQEPRGGYWLAGHSPDGSKVAIYSMINGRTAAGIVDLRTRKPYFFKFTPNYYRWLIQKPVWVSNDQLVYATIPHDQQPSLYSRSGMTEELGRRWKKTLDGEKPSATVLVSSTTGLHDAENYRAGSLVLANGSTGHVRTLSHGYFFNLLVSPSRTHVAGLKQAGRLQPAADQMLSNSTAFRSQLVLFDSSNGSSAIPCPDCNVLPRTLAWSPDGQTLSFLAHRLGNDLTKTELLQYAIDRNELRNISISGFQFTCGTFSAGTSLPLAAFGGVIAFGRLRPAGSGAALAKTACDADGRDDWFLLRPGETPLNLTGSLGSVAPRLVAALPDAVLLLANGDIWRLEGVDEQVNITAHVDDALSLWPGAAGGADRRESSAVLLSKDRVFALDATSGSLRSMRRPNRDSTLMAINERGDGAVFRQESTDGTRLTLAGSGEKIRTLLHINAFMAEIAASRTSWVNYSANGTSLSSCILLPGQQSPSGKYPAVIYAYPGLTGDCLVDSVGVDVMNLGLLTARGYAVVFPQTPTMLIRGTEGPTQGITSLVLAAVEAAERKGLVDGARLGLLGFSQGFHDALQIASETGRFKAVVAAHGISNFASHYGQIPLSSRIAGNPAALAGGSRRYEHPASENWLGVPPWEDPERYIRNSPVFNVHRIEAPVLLLHSDLDSFPLAQSEEMFGALYRLRKEAVHVTYWGEMHWNLSPANVRDAWERTIGWFDEHL